MEDNKSNGDDGFHFEKGLTRWTNEKGLFKKMMFREMNPGITNNFNRSTRYRLIEGLRLTKRLQQHDGCVNTIRWDRCGRNLVSASDDLKFCVWSGSSFELLGAIQTGHRRNIFCAEFVPINNSQVVSCGADGDMRLTDLEKGENGKLLKGKTTLLAPHPGATAMKFEFLINCQSAFLTTYSSGEVKLIDLRSDNREEKLIVDMENSCYGLSFDPTHPNEFAISSGDHIVRVYDIRKSPLPFGRDKPSGCIMMYSTEKFIEQMGLGDNIEDDWGWGRQRFSPTDVCFSSRGELLVNYSGYDVLLYDASDNAKSNAKEGLNGTPLVTTVLQKYKGRANEETFLKEVHFLADEQFVTTGGDTGELFIWDKVSGELVSRLQADKLIVNSIAAHPFYTTVAVSGIDNDIKVFEYRGENPFPQKRKFSEERQPSPFGLSQRIRSNNERDVLSESEANESLEKAIELKSQADKLYTQDKPKEAVQSYNRCLRKLLFHPPHYKLQKELDSLIVKCNLNLAACFLKLKDYTRVVDTCTNVLDIEKKNAKALYRRASAYLFLSKLKKAKKDIDRAIKLRPEDIEIKALHQKIEKEIELKGINNNSFFTKMFEHK